MNLDHFGALELIGEGTFGKVLKDETETYAIKIGTVYEQEVNTLTYLEDKGFYNTPQLISYDLNEGILVMEYIKGKTYSELGLDYFLNDFLDIYTELLWCGVVHGDYHTGNLILSDDGEILVIDFANACIYDDIESPYFIYALYQDIMDFFSSGYITLDTYRSVNNLLAEYLEVENMEDLENTLLYNSEPIPLLEEIIDILTK